MKPLIRPAISVLLIALSILGMLNVYSDNSDVEALARRAACPSCDSEHLRLAMLSRSPLSQTFHFEPAITAQGSPNPEALPKVIECSRSAVFIGDYSCNQK